MKRGQVLVFILLMIAIAACKSRNSGNHDSSGNQLPDTGNAVISFTEYEHFLGRVKEGEKVGCIFTFTNTGTTDLVINSALTSCGCTVSKYDRKPISPGHTGSLEVVFNSSGYNGQQTKTITVHSNAKVPVVILKIVAEVINSDNN
jgi:hypothetical protein